MGPLRAIRESMGFRVEEVAARCSWPPARLRALEQAEDIDDDDAATLSDVYGVDVVALLEGGSTDQAPPVVRALLRAQADVLDAHSRFAIAEAVGVAVECADLHKLLGEPVGWAALSRFKHNADYSHPRNGVPERMAEGLRRALGLGDGPLPSLLEITRRLGVRVFVTDLAPHLDAFSFATARTSGVIVLGGRGAHTRSPFGRRVTLAHELCHVLFDRPKMRGMADFCSIARGDKERPDSQKAQTHADIERRARAFAVYLLAPRASLASAWSRLAASSTRDRIRTLMEHFGLGYEAIRAHLDNAGLLPLGEPVTLVETEAPGIWHERDPLPVRDDPRLGAVPLPRRGEYFDLVVRCWRAQALSESGAREALRVPLADWSPVRDALAAEARRSPTAVRWSTSSALEAPAIP